jgi:hypothetical protein
VTVLSGLKIAKWTKLSMPLGGPRRRGPLGAAVVT